MPKISKRVVDASHPKEARYFVWDDGLPGFGLVIQSSGVKSYVYQYRTPEGRSRRITIGKHGALTSDQARTKARELQYAVSHDGRDPVEEKRGRKRALTVGDLLDRYLGSSRFAEKAAMTQQSDKGRISNHLLPLLGRKIAEKLKPEEIRSAAASITAGKTAREARTTGPRGRSIVRGGEGVARMSVRLLKAAFSWAEENELITRNATRKVKAGQDGRRDIVLTEADYARLFSTLDAMESVFAIRRTAADAIRIIALVGARRGEIAGLKWGHVNLKKGIIELPVGSHKTGKKTGESRIIGLPAAAMALIARQPEGKPDDYVFRPLRGAGPIQLSKIWRKVRKEAGLNPAIGLHGLRHSLATLMAAKGAQAAHIMSALGHRDIATSQKYIHLTQDIRQQIAEDAATGLSAILEGRKPGDVVRLRGES